MSAPLQVESTLTEKYQATVPGAIRKALKLEKRDKIRFTLQPDGSVIVSRAVSADSDDAAVEHFIELLARELDSHPERFRALSSTLLKQARAITKGLRAKAIGAGEDQE